MTVTECEQARTGLRLDQLLEATQAMTVAAVFMGHVGVDGGMDQDLRLLVEMARRCESRVGMWATEGRR